MKIEIKKFLNFLKNFKKRIFENLVLLLATLLLIDLIIGGIFFWKYYLKVIKEKPKIIPPFKINQTLLNQFSNTYQKRQELFEEIKKKEYFDIFKPVSPLEQKD